MAATAPTLFKVSSKTGAPEWKTSSIFWHIDAPRARWQSAKRNLLYATNRKMISFLSIIAIGFFLGMRHATDPDHVIAVTTIVSRQNKIRRAALTGIFWGVGHTLTIFVVGTAIILFGVVIPARIGLSMELSVALMLVILGVMNIVAFVRSARSFAKVEGVAATVHAHHHSHGDYIHTHPHGHTPESHPHAPEKTPLARMDRLFGGLGIYRQFRPLLVGIVHGLAGSAAVALLVLTTIRDPRWAIAYLLVFGMGTVAGMMLITMSIASAFSFFGRKHANFRVQLGLASGLLSLAFGLVLVYQVGFASGLFVGQPTWTPR
jgi:ABC-type nickel/cobalt efflux system permease component RcnA